MVIPSTRKDYGHGLEHNLFPFIVSFISITIINYTL